MQQKYEVGDRVKTITEYGGRNEGGRCFLSYGVGLVGTVKKVYDWDEVLEVVLDNFDYQNTFATNHSHWMLFEDVKKIYGK